MHAPSTTILLLITVTLSAFSHSVAANRCGEISPLLLQLDDQYYALDHVPISELRKHSIEHTTLVKTLKTQSFDGGHGRRTLCFGVSDIREETREFTLDSIQPVTVNSSNEVVLKAFEYDKENQTLRSESVFIPLSRKDIIYSGSKRLLVSTRHRQATVFGGSYLKEVSLLAADTERGIVINQLIYVNGELAEWFTWHLNS